MAQVFVSYAHKNNEFVAVLKQQLLDAGFEPLIDTEFLRPGEDWRQEIDAAIRGSFALIAVMTPEAFESKYVTYEWAFALGIGVKVIPLMLENTKLHPRLDTLQYIPFDAHFKLDDAWKKLLTRLKQVEEEYKASPKVKVLNDIPTYVRDAIDIFNHPQYFNTTDAGLLGNLYDAVKTLSSSKHPAAREAFLRGLEYPNPAIRKSVIEICGSKRDKAAISSLIAAIRDTDISVRSAAIGALVMIGDEECVTGLIDALGDHNYRVRISAADGLSNFKSSKSVSALLVALKDKVGFVRAHAAKSLGIIGDARAISALVKLLDDKAGTAQRFAWDALRQIGTPEALAAIEEWRQKRRKQQT